MRWLGLKEMFFRFLKRLGIKVPRPRRQEMEKRLDAMLAGASGIKCRPLDKDHRHIQIIQVRDSADVYNLFRTLCSGHTIVCTYNKDGKTEYICEGLTLRNSYTAGNGGCASRLIWSSDYQLRGIGEIRFKITK